MFRRYKCVRNNSYIAKQYGKQGGFMRLKRFFSAAMAVLTLVSLSACGGTTDTNKGMSDVTV